MRTYLKIKLGALVVIASALAFQWYSPAAHAGDFCYQFDLCTDFDTCWDAYISCSNMNPYPGTCVPSWPVVCHDWDFQCWLNYGDLYSYRLECTYEYAE